jgi:hypothetical protein
MYLENIIFNEMQDKYENFHRKSNNFGILKPVFYNYFSRIEVPVPNIVSLIEELDDIMNTRQISIIGKDLIKYFLNLLEDHGERIRNCTSRSIYSKYNVKCILFRKI